MFSPELRQKWLSIAESLKPDLTAQAVSPLRSVAAHRNDDAFQGWDVIEDGTVEAVNAKTWITGGSFILDFGAHLVGYFECSLSAVGTVDAPARVQFIFGETVAEVAEPFDPFTGSLSRGWLQDEILTIDVFPYQLRLPRRYAFRYVKITALDVSMPFSVRFSEMRCHQVTSADYASVSTLPEGLPRPIQELDKVSLRTLANCMQTVFEDGPKRDRRLWIGDLRLQALVNYASFKNYALVKRCLYLFAALAHEDGAVAACVFEEPRPHRGHCDILDYLALFVNTLLDYAEASDDWETAAELWPVAQRQTERLRDFIDADGLFIDPGTWWIFIDWQDGLRKQTAMHGVAICSFEAAAALARRLGHDGEAKELNNFAEKMKQAALDSLLCPERGLFLSEPLGENVQISWASQTWMVQAGVVKGDAAANLMNTLLASEEAVKPSGPYLYHYVVDSLLRAGLKKSATALLSEYWGGMIERGATTFWEVYDAARPLLSPYNNHLLNSYCHAWSCTPAWFIRNHPGLFREEPVIFAEVEPRNVICERFLGFGVEWDSNAYDASGVTDQDFEVIRKRVEWMRLPITRIMMQARWCYQGKDQHEWDAPEMRSLYRHLDVCQKLGTIVVLTEWGIEPAWLKTPDVAKVEDPKYARLIATYLDYLINKRAYTCIKYFTLVNEPNYEVKDWERWKEGIQNVAAELRRTGLDRQITIMGSDHSNADEWHTNAVDQLQNELGAYDIHYYASKETVKAGALHDYCKSNWTYVLAGDPKARDKPLIIGEAGFWMEGSGSDNNPAHLDPEYGVLMADYAVQAATAGSWAILAWMLDDNSHLNFTWGMCRNKVAGLAIKPWFFAWALLARYFSPGATIVRVGSTSKDVGILAAYVDNSESPDQRHWTFCIVNRANALRTVRLRVSRGPAIRLKRYIYSVTSSRADEDGFPVVLDDFVYKLGTGAEIRCEANSMVLLTSI